MRKELFTYTANAKGYMLSYRGEPIGGAGIAGEYKGTPKMRTEQIEEYRRMANREIDAIVAGHSIYYKQQIQFMEAKVHKLYNYADIIGLYMRSTVTKPEDRKNILPRLQDLAYYNHEVTVQLYKDARTVRQLLGDAFDRMEQLETLTVHEFKGNELIKGN